MGDILVFPGGTTLPLPVERVLSGALACRDLLVLGVTPTGEFYAAASVADGYQLLWWLECFKHKLLSGDYASG